MSAETIIKINRGIDWFRDNKSELGDLIVTLFQGAAGGVGMLFMFNLMWAALG